MRVFVSEYLTCGAWNGPPEPSLIREGRAMLVAIARDFARVANSSVVTTWDARWPRPDLREIEVVPAESPAHESHLFTRLATESDAVFVIAPETAGRLAERRRTLDEMSLRALGPELAAIELATDKLRLAKHLLAHDIPTIPTFPFDPACFDPTTHEIPCGYPAVVKPRDGAGSLHTWVLSGSPTKNPTEKSISIRALPEEFATDHASSFVVQPFVSGRTLSVGVLIGTGGRVIEMLPVAEQRLSDDGRLRYLGGRISAYDENDANAEAIRRLVVKTIATIPGLCGYVGFDLIVPHDSPQCPVLVEINPRLTTSYLGYRAATGDNLAERILHPDRIHPPIAWGRNAVEFDA